MYFFFFCLFVYNLLFCRVGPVGALRRYSVLVRTTTNVGQVQLSIVSNKALLVDIVYL